ncbi:MAG: hypothetical protein GX160_07660, partial [Clostridiales bacterium]|nr:hypothetical protein [Clostridiales bacterium]
MKRLKSLEWIANGIIFVVLTGSLAHSLFVSIYISIPFYKTIVITLLFYLVLSIFSMWPIIIFLVIGTVPIAIWLFKIPLPDNWFIKVFEFLRWSIYYPLGGASFDETLVKPFVFLVIGLFSIILYIFTIRLHSLILPLIFGVTLLGVEWYLGHTSITPYIWGFTFAIILIMANKRYVKLSKIAYLPSHGLWLMWTIPFALIAITSAYILIPKDTTALKWQTLENVVENIRENRIGRSSFTQARQPFRLSSTGFSGPEGELGGPVKLNRDIVLEVQAPFPAYLRGNILNHYTGTSWMDTVIDYRYKFSNQKWSETKRMAFDMDEALWEDIDNLDFFIHEGLLSPYKITIKHVGIESSVLFNIQFTKNIHPQKRNSFITYFNNSSETFTSRNINADELYIIEGVVPRNETPEFANLIDQYSKKYPKDSHDNEMLSKDEYILENYTQLPDTLPDRVVNLASSIVKDANSPYEMVMEIQNYLKENYSYTLDTPYTPPNRDFVDFFLFDLEEGYCTYFATAMAVMLRSVGIPTRYVEGFSMLEHSIKGESNVYTVRNSDAHAWVEVYFPNIGWLPFDPTPRYRESSVEQDLITNPTYRDYIDEYLRYYPEYDEDFQQNANFDSSNHDLADEYNRNKIFTIIIVITCLIVFILIVFGLVVLLWYYLTRVKPKTYTTRVKLMFYYNKILWLLGLYSFPPLAGETPYAYANRVDAWLINEKTNMTEVTRILVEYQYAS